ncbi:hypothetical protein GCM10017691_18160 [Pseudonocardia petroleophila]|uniref:Uncharacterized protein n=1 Tax=Pseudonocardia petroleophila TaxID=37331 RepID=A0A7G7MH69_9PSEU|nr:hypothetical protein [Pseudonocardia petroleophila]QNG52130.1 hypothetical protein H6H00_29480 [Pseudonocardia petroleophila]
MPPVPRGGSTVVAATWAVAGVVHLLIALRGDGAGAVLGFALAAVALVGAAALLVDPRPELLVVAAVAGVVGVAAFALPLILPLLGIGGPATDPLDAWRIGAFVVDALTVRLAAFTLRRAGRARA